MSSTDFDTFTFYSLKEERPKGKGIISVNRYKQEKLMDDFIPRPHTVFLGMFSEQTAEEEHKVVIYFTGGFSAADENVVVDGFKQFRKVTLLVSHNQIKIENIVNIGKIPTTITSGAGDHLDGNQDSPRFLIFGGLDPQQRVCDDWLRHCTISHSMRGYKAHVEIVVPEKDAIWLDMDTLLTT